MRFLIVAVLASVGIAAGQPRQASGSRFADRLKPSNSWQETVREPLKPPQSGADKELYDARGRWADKVYGLGMPLDEMYDRGGGWAELLALPSD